MAGKATRVASIAFRLQSSSAPVGGNMAQSKLRAAGVPPPSGPRNSEVMPPNRQISQTPTEPSLRSRSGNAAAGEFMAAAAHASCGQKVVNDVAGKASGVARTGSSSWRGSMAARPASGKGTAYSTGQRNKGLDLRGSVAINVTKNGITRIDEAQPVGRA